MQGLGKIQNCGCGISMTFSVSQRSARSELLVRSGKGTFVHSFKYLFMTFFVPNIVLSTGNKTDRQKQPWFLPSQSLQTCWGERATEKYKYELLWCTHHDSARQDLKNVQVTIAP